MKKFSPPIIIFVFFGVPGLAFLAGCLNTGSGIGGARVSTALVFNDSRAAVSYAGPHEGMAIGGTIKNMAGDPLAAYIRVFNKVRTPNHTDVFAQAYANIDGEFLIDMPERKAPGEYEVIIYRGPEYEYFSVIVDVREDSITNLNVNLARITDMAADGWFGGEIHQHSQTVSPGYGSDGRNTMEEMAEANAAVGLHFGVLTDHNQTAGTGNSRFAAEGLRYSLDSGSMRFLPIAGCEVTTVAGHFNAWDPGDGTGGHYYVDVSVDTSSMESKIEGVSRIADDMKAHSLLSVINHPSSPSLSYIDPNFDWLANRDLTLKFDAVEIWNSEGFITTWAGSYGSIPYFGAEDDPSHIDHSWARISSGFFEWYKLLNAGEKIPAVGSSDSHNRSGILEGNSLDRLIDRVREAYGGTLPIFGSFDETLEALTPLFGSSSAANYAFRDYRENMYENMTGIPGMPRTYAYIGEKSFDQENIAAAVKNGNTFVSCGPLVKAEINGRMPGETANVSRAQNLSLDILCNRTFNRIQIIADGELVRTIDTSGINIYRNTLRVPELKGKKWAIVYVEGGDNFQFAFTNPIYFR